MAALITLLVIEGYYPPPLEIDQSDLLKKISAQGVIGWNEVIQEELASIRSMCRQADIDFAFVVDSSGSVGPFNWGLTMNLIGEKWIKEVIIPSGAKKCGNHVAGRRFSSSSVRFHDFEPPARSSYAPSTYAEFVGNKFINQTFYGGGTNTAYALRQTRQVDLPTARDGLKYVMFFLDGTKDLAATTYEAQLLHGVANRTYAFGIGPGAGMDFLNAIASDPAYVGTMTTFSQLEAYVRKFVIEQQGCQTQIVQPHRGIDLNEASIAGMSYQTSSEQAAIVDEQCNSSDVCPTKESNRKPTCQKCSAEIGNT